MVRLLRKVVWGVLLGTSLQAVAQTPSPSAIGWLRYAIPPDPPRYHDMPHAVVLLGDGMGHATPEEETAADELDRGLGHMVAGTDVLLRHIDPRNDAIILGTPDSLRRARLGRIARGWTDKPVPEEGFRIVHLREGIRQWWVLEGGSPRGELYAAFRFAALVAEDRQLPEEWSESPRVGLRAVALEGDAPEEPVLRQYGRLMASVGMNGVVVHGTKADAQRVLRPFGIRVWGSTEELERERAMQVLPGMLPGAPLSGLVPVGASASPFVAALDVLPGGLRQQVTPIQAWSQTLKALQPRLRAGGALGSMPADAVLPLLDQPLLQANLFAFGRTLWNPDAGRASTLDDWARQTFGDDARIFGVAKDIVAGGEAAYRDVTSPMGLPRLGTERGPSPTAFGRYDGKAVADRSAVGLDLSHEVAKPAAQDTAGDARRCPAEWLLLLHREPYEFRRADGRTIAESVYDAVFTGASASINAVDAWDETRPLLDAERWQPVHDLLEETARRAEIWRDAVAAWLYRTSGIPDALGYAGRHPGRTEAEAMTLTGYKALLTEGTEAASGGSYVSCSTAADCAAAMTFTGEANVYRVETGYFDAAGAAQRFTLRVNGSVRATWTSVARGAGPGGETAARFVQNGVRLKPGDTVEVRSSGALDFVEITRDPRWN